MQTFAQSRDTLKTAVDTKDTISSARAGSFTQKSVPPQQPQVKYPSFMTEYFPSRTAFEAFLLSHNNFYVADGKVLFHPEKIREKEYRTSHFQTHLFYVFLGLFLLLGLTYSAFKKYFHDLFEAFTSPTLSRRQLKDQLSQTPFPSLVFNVFFTLSLGLYLFLLFHRKGLLPKDIPIYFAGYFVLFLIFIYVLKYLSLRFLGWVLEIKEIVEGYMFTIFLINKILGIVLLPVILILAFSPSFLSNIVLDISVLFVVVFLGYRYFRAFPVLTTSIKISKFHFFIYLCAFEVVPVLVLGKIISMWASAI